MRFTGETTKLAANIERLVENFNTSARTILGIDVNDEDITSEMITSDMAEACALFLEALATDPSPSAVSLSTEIYSLAYIAIAKQGNITEAKLASISTAISIETGREITLSMPDIITFNNSFKPYINSNNAEAICRGLQTGMTGYSLRLSITMQQAVRSGMTSYWAIWDALSSYQNFPWADAAKMIPQDFAKYLEAVALVGSNEYYGFNEDLGSAKHTFFPSLSWLACKLLMKCDPPGYEALSRYRGISKPPKRQEGLQEMIDDYNPSLEDAGDQTGAEWRNLS